MSVPVLAALAADPLETWGQIAAIVLAIELLVFVLLALGLSIGLFFAFAWVQEKSELIKRLRPAVDQLNQALETSPTERSTEGGALEHPLVQGVVSLPERVRAVDRRVEQGSDRVAEAVIEFRARTVMVKEMARAFFLPGLVRREARQQELRRAAEAGAELREDSREARPSTAGRSVAEDLPATSEAEGAGRVGAARGLSTREGAPAQQAVQSMRHVSPH
ncbi:hypothetical protein [Thermogemmatispora tikiterensis]|uniref:Uncharacterized protein n=1 Tax=Thermogemmatispora tikiterensis TaxID=1825093 RepID=A0A328VN69_9CHLR|nr:hypothetical protein [Thermogemmatispora tikiterensis]RAQ97083.1 hypothetical protein A4R35_16205 [Thermogemmatispora tikiterensis]